MSPLSDLSVGRTLCSWTWRHVVISEVRRGFTDTFPTSGRQYHGIAGSNPRWRSNRGEESGSEFTTFWRNRASIPLTTYLCFISRRVAEFQQSLSGPVIDSRHLRRLCFSGKQSIVLWGKRFSCRASWTGVYLVFAANSNRDTRWSWHQVIVLESKCALAQRSIHVICPTLYSALFWNIILGKGMRGWGGRGGEGWSGGGA